MCGKINVNSYLVVAISVQSGVCIAGMDMLGVVVMYTYASRKNKHHAVV